MFFVQNLDHADVIKKELREIPASESLEGGTRANAAEGPLVVSATGWDADVLPDHEAEHNKPARLVCLCLKYRGNVTAEKLSKAVTSRLFGKEPTICSSQNDGALTLFFELESPMALPQDKFGAEQVLELWANAHGLSHIAGVELDWDHYLSQLVLPTFIGERQARTDAMFPLAKDALFVGRLAKELAQEPFDFETESLLPRLEMCGWRWESSAPFQVGSVGLLHTPRYGTARAIVTANGFRSLGDYLPIFTYEAILGEAAWAEMSAVKRDRAYCDSYYYREMDREYYALVSDNKVRRCTHSEYQACLESLYNMGRSGVMSLIRNVVVHKKVDGVRNYMYASRRLIQVDGKTYLNTSDVSLLSPDEKAPSDTFRKSCPAITVLLNTLFGEKSKERSVFLSWLALAYQGAYYGRPRRGHAMYVVGAPGTGKTLLRELLGLLFGRSRSGQEFFCESSQFNAYALDDNPLVYLDDASVEWRRCNQMHNRIKELVATGEASLNGKYEAQRHVEWFGRILVTCNPAGEGRKLIPEIGDDNRDKFIILKTTNKRQDDQQLGECARRELPAFAHFLKHFRSELMDPDCRFGMEAYVSPAVVEATLFRDGEGMLVECLERILKAAQVSGAVQDYTVTELYDKLVSEPAVATQLAGLCTAKNLGAKLCKIREAVEAHVVDFPYGISTRRTSSRRSWVFTPSAREASQVVTPESESDGTEQ